MPPPVEPETESECYKYLKVTTDSISVSDTSDSQSYAPAVSFRRSRITFSNLFQVFLGSESLEDFIGRVIIKFLSKWIEFDHDNNTLRFRTPVIVDENLTVNGDVSANSELNVSSNLKVLGTAEFEKDVLVKGGLVEVNDTPQ